MTTPKELPILFNGEMVRAILDGIKLATRRIVKVQPVRQPILFEWRWLEPRSGNGPALQHKCPYGKPGDLLYVRETHLIPWGTWMSAAGTIDGYRAPGAVEFCADGAEPRALNPDVYGSPYMRKMPSIHMLKSDSRIWLRVESVGVERLQEIDEAGAIAEGVDPGCYSCGESALPDGCGCDKPTPVASDAFFHLWDSINGDGDHRWDADPWVWVVKFSVASTTGRPA